MIAKFRVFQREAALKPVINNWQVVSDYRQLRHHSLST